MPLNGSLETLTKMRGLRDVVRFLSDINSPIRRAMSQMPGDAGQMFAVHGAAIAMAMAEFTPALLGKETVNVLVVTEGGTELLDGGRWLQTASLLTGVDLNISAIVTDGTEDLAQPSQLAELLSALKGARFHRHGPEGILSSGERPDLIVLPTPSFSDDVEQPQKWAWLSDMMAEGIPVVGWTYDELERDMAQAFVQAMGFSAMKLAYSALSFEERPHPAFINQHGKFLFQLCPLEEEVLEVDEGTLRSLAMLGRRFSAAMQHGTATPWGGAIFKSAKLEVLVDMSGRAVGLEDGAIYDVLVGRRGEPVFCKTERVAYEWTPLTADELMAFSRLKRVLIAEDACAHRLFEGMEELLEPEGMAEALGFLGIPQDDAQALSAMFCSDGGVKDGMPMFVAASENDAAAIIALAGDGVDPNEYDSSGWTALHQAVADESLDAIEALLRVGADIEGRHKISGMTALDIAMQRERSDAALMLLKAGASLDNQAMMGEVARTLLDAGIGSAKLQAWYRSRPKD